MNLIEEDKIKLIAFRKILRYVYDNYNNEDINFLDYIIKKRYNGVRVNDPNIACKINSWFNKFGSQRDFSKFDNNNTLYHEILKSKLLQRKLSRELNDKQEAKKVKI